MMEFRLFVLLLCFGSCKSSTVENMETMQQKLPQTQNSVIRLSRIEVYPEFLEEYKVFATEVGEVSMRTEVGVLAMYGMSAKDDPCNITILEIYADSASYKLHIASAHFQKYKIGTFEMVKSLELVDQRSMNQEMKLQQLYSRN